MSNGGYSSHTIEKANKAKITIENFYTNFLQQQQEREERLHQCEEALGKFAFWFSTGELILEEIDPSAKYRVWSKSKVSIELK